MYQDRISKLYQVFEGQSGQIFQELYDEEKPDENINQLIDKVIELINTIDSMGSWRKYKFRSYSPGFVQVDPFFFYFDEDDELKRFLFERNAYHKPEDIKIEWNIEDQKVKHVHYDGKEWVIGFVDKI